MYAAPVTQRRCLCLTNFVLGALKVTVASEVGMPGFSNILIGRSGTQYGPGIKGARELFLLVLFKCFARDTQFSLDSDRSAIRC
jgi:hypothetical protein